jgi:hypothetical protein
MPPSTTSLVATSFNQRVVDIDTEIRLASRMNWIGLDWIGSDSDWIGLRMDLWILVTADNLRGPR